MKNIFFIIVIALFTACDRQVIIDLGTPPRRLVMSSTLDADSLIQVHVNRSVSSLDKNGPIAVTTAKVELFENDILLETLNAGNAGNYKFSHKPQAGKTYRINCSYENYESITAQTVLPYPVEIVSATIDTNGISTQYGETVNLKLSINDPAGQSNYYLIKLMYRDVFNDYNYSVYMTSADPLFNQTDEFIIDDITFNGKQRTFSFSMYKPQFQYQPIENYVFELHHLNYDAYQFVVTFNRYLNNYNNPFAEPIQVYSNVSSKMGQLSGRAVSRKPLTP
jgi:hypothetical protein